MTIKTKKPLQSKPKTVPSNAVGKNSHTITTTTSQAQPDNTFGITYKLNGTVYGHSLPLSQLEHLPILVATALLDFERRTK